VADQASIDLDELVEHWTVLDDERALIDAKYGATRLGFALLLKSYTRHGRFPAGPADLPDAVVDFVARQLRVDAADLGSYEWAGRSIERHRAQIREQLGFRECAVADAEKLTGWLLSMSPSASDAMSACATSCWRAVAASGSSRRRRAASTASCGRRCA
jgi:hypothetical protein